MGGRGGRGGGTGSGLTLAGLGRGLTGSLGSGRAARELALAAWLTCAWGVCSDISDGDGSCGCQLSPRYADA